MNEVARHAGLSGSRLSVLFKEQTGLSLQAFRSKERLRCFFQLQQETSTQRTLLESAFEAGFTSYVQFYRVFREHVGMSPRRYFKAGIKPA